MGIGEAVRGSNIECGCFSMEYALMPSEISELCCSCRGKILSIDMFVESPVVLSL